MLQLWRLSSLETWHQYRNIPWKTLCYRDRICDESESAVEFQFKVVCLKGPERYTISNNPKRTRRQGVCFSEGIGKTLEKTGIALCLHRQYAFTRDKQFFNRKSDEFLFTELHERDLKKSGFNDGSICAASLAVEHCNQLK